ncbi:MAG: ComEC/Rec2 family competence protein [Planctomycetes bacterium]|nr:ComEC/Rec2 family competence protein [Planctomycetota bacterium]
MGSESNCVRYQPLVVVAAALALGMVLDRTGNIPMAAWWILFAGLLPVWAVFWRQGYLRPAGLCLLAAVTSLGGAWHGWAWRWFPRDELGRFCTAEPQGMAIEARVESAPRRLAAPAPDPLTSVMRGERTRLRLTLLGMRRGGRWQSASGRVAMTVEGQVVGIFAGDRIRARVRAARIGRPMNPGELDFAEQARSERRLCWLFAESPDALSLVERDAGWRWRHGIRWLRELGESRLARHVDADQAALATAMLLGAREQLDEQLQDAYFETGLSHLIAISGLNVAIFAFGFWTVARMGWLSRRFALLIAIALAITYAILTDSQSPVVRAAVLLVCVCWGRYQGRRGLGMNTLAAAWIVILIAQPAALFQVGTQLSFLAVAVLGTVTFEHGGVDESDPLDRLIARHRPWGVRLMITAYRMLARSFWVSAAVWWAALPLVWYRFQLVSPIALLLNPLVVLPMALALYGGFAVFITGFFSDTAADFCGSICAMNLRWIEWLLHAARKVPGNHVWLPAPDGRWVACAYVGLALWTLYPGLHPPRRWQAALLLLFSAVGVWSAGLTPLPRSPALDGDLVCTFVAVGHGTAVILEFPDGRTMLYDAGHMGAHQAGTRSVLAAIRSRKISHLDAIVISHADLDHYNAVPGILDQLTVGVVYVTREMFRQPSPALMRLRQAIDAHRVRLERLRTGDRFRFPEREFGSRLAVEILHPPASGIAGSDNANSVVMLVEHSGYRLLLPGDLEEQGMEALLANPRLNCDLVMAPHHGSRGSRPAWFLNWCLPEWVIISCGPRGAAPSVAEAYGPEQRAVITTHARGAIEVRIGPQGVRVRPHCAAPPDRH